MKISVLTTLYYSSAYIQEFYTRSLAAVKKTGLEYEFVFVNDGSPDDVLDKVLDLQKSDPQIRIVDLSRNFGHAKAIMTGLQYCTGDYIFLIDCDLEEEPEMLTTFWEKLRADPSYDVIHGIQVKRKGGWFERASGWLFYKFISSLTSVDYPSNSLTARLMSKRYVEAVTQYKERELEIWGVFVLSGFKQLEVPAKKGYKGSTTYTFGKKLAVAIDAITSLSNKPLYFTFILGFLTSFFAVINVLVIVYKKLVLNIYVEGWASTQASIWLVGGMILFVLGVFGIYLAKMFNEIKGRPLSIVKKIYDQNAK